MRLRLRDGGHRPFARAEPSLIDPYDAGASELAEVPAPRTVTFVDRHPLLSRPRDYYQSSGQNPVVKATAATVIGIPAGVFGEIRQIVVGQPPELRPY